jgi:2-polyprenyl-3-methyl-5-hydroxy-6-metoxy-1,4-benzoquinol methylase
MNIIRSIKRRIHLFLHKNKKYKTEEEFYTYFFTQHPSWSSPEPNEDETIRWKEIKEEVEKIHQAGQNLRILEIGCGRGWLCKKMSAYGTVTGIDPIEPVIKYAQKIFPGIEFHADTPVSFHQKAGDKKFNLVVSTEVLEHVNDKKEFLDTVNSLLIPGGFVVLTTPKAEHYEDFIKFYGKDVEQPLEAWLTVEQLRTLFTETGFEIITNRFLAPLSAEQPQILMTQLWVAKKK